MYSEYLESLTNKAVKKLSLNVDKAVEASREPISILKTVDQKTLEFKRLQINLFSSGGRAEEFEGGDVDSSVELHLHRPSAHDPPAVIVLDVSQQALISSSAKLNRKVKQSFTLKSVSLRNT